MPYLIRRTCIGHYQTTDWWSLQYEVPKTEKFVEFYSRDAFKLEILEVELTDLSERAICKLLPNVMYIKLFVMKDYQQRIPKYTRPPQKRWTRFVTFPHYGVRYNRHKRAWVGNGLWYWPVVLKITRVIYSDIGRKEK